ncbi:MAG TPA: hypothetical protein VFC39_13530 [Acidobacteriaceae bacterium]|nr:hypothetical protein [Acidobacteriaceae bacterium]
MRLDKLPFTALLAMLQHQHTPEMLSAIQALLPASAGERFIASLQADLDYPSRT